MTTVNIHEAKTHLSRLLEEVAAGESVTIAKAGKPVAKLVRIDFAQNEQRIGFMAGFGQVPDDFDEMETDLIATMFSES